MIKLDLDYYCNDCPYFEGEITKIYADSECHTLIRCENASKCKELYKRFTAIDRAASIDPDSCE